jgi:hypothetical protein
MWLFAIALPVQALQVEGTPQIIPYQIWFNWGSASKAVTMNDACTEQPITTPEGDYDLRRNNPSAYVRGSTLTIKVKWRVQWGSVSKALVAATGSFGGLSPKAVTFKDGKSDWITMTAVDPLPDSIKVNDVLWTWYYQTNSSGITLIGQSKHTIYTLNKTPLTSLVYLDLVEWTTDWCQGLPDDAKAISDAIINGFAATGVIRYGAAGWDTAEILCTGDGMCGGMKEVFYEACGTQGVHVARSCYILKDADPGAEYKWKSMIIFSPGLGRTEPTFAQQYIREVDTSYPCPRYYGDSSPEDDVELESRRAYEFFAPSDGHCINFLEYGGKIYLYDLSFGTGPWPDTFTSLPQGYKKGVELYDFRENYMNTALDYMRGNVYYDYGTGTCTTSGNLDINSWIIPYDDTEFMYYWSTSP